MTPPPMVAGKGGGSPATSPKALLEKRNSAPRALFLGDPNRPPTRGSPVGAVPGDRASRVSAVSRGFLADGNNNISNGPSRASTPGGHLGARSPSGKFRESDTRSIPDGLVGDRSPSMVGDHGPTLSSTSRVSVKASALEEDYV